LVDELQKMNSEIASLSRSTRIEQFAVDSLGLQRLETDRMYTLIADSPGDPASDDLDMMFSSIKRVADYLPVLSQTQAKASELQPIRIDSPETVEGQE